MHTNKIYVSMRKQITMGDMQFNGTPEEWDALVKKNKQKTTKLYTEEQLRKAHQNGRHGGNNENWHDTEAYINSLTPIQLPTDEEIEDNAKDYANLIGNKNGTSIFDYVRGAKWMRNKIINK